MLVLASPDYLSELKNELETLFTPGIAVNDGGSYADGKLLHGIWISKFASVFKKCRA